MQRKASNRFVAVFMTVLMVVSSFAAVGAAVIPVGKAVQAPQGQQTQQVTGPASYVTDIEQGTARSTSSTSIIEDKEIASFDPPNVAEIAQRNAAKADSRIYVVSDEDHVVIALGTNATGYKRFPLADPNMTDGLVSGQAITITGQLVDGHSDNITAINSGGLSGNHGIGGSGPGPTLTVRWTLKDAAGTQLPGGAGTVNLDWNDGTPGNPSINGTFKITGLVPAMSPAGLAKFTFCFDGYQGNPPPPGGGKVYPPNGKKDGSATCANTYSGDVYPVYIQHPVVPTVEVTPEPANAGEPITVSGTLKDDQDLAVGNEGLVVSYENPKGTYATIGKTMPAGLYVDDVVVTAGPTEILNENFEEGFDTMGWTHAGQYDEWEAGVPGSTGPTSSHSPVKCAGTDVTHGAYEIQTDSYLVTPNLNLSGYASATLNFWYWLDIADNDYGSVEASPDGGIRWYAVQPRYTKSQKDWDSVTVDLTSIPDPKKPTQTIQFAGNPNVLVRFRIVSMGFSIYTDTEGDYSFSYTLPPESIPARHNIKVVHPKTTLYLAAMTNVSIRVRRTVHFEFINDTVHKVGYRNKWVDPEMKAKLIDNMGDVPQANIEGLPQSYLVRVFWDQDPQNNADNPIPVDQRTITLGSVNESRNGWVMVSYLVPLSQPLGWVGVIFKYDGSDYYKPISQTDTYAVKAHTQINAPPPEQLKFYRGSHINLQGNLVVIPSESQTNPKGDPVPWKDLRIYWENKELTRATTDKEGKFSREFFVGESHSLGRVQVKFTFEGDFPYMPVDASFNMSVVSRTYISFVSPTNFREYKGKTIEIKGAIKDDLGTAIPELPVIITKVQRGSEKTLGRATSGVDGTFSMKYKIPYEDRVGNLTISARFDGTDKFEPSTNRTNYTIMVDTTIVRVDDTFDVVRGEQMTLTGLLYEDWDGTLGYMVPFEAVTITLGRVPLTTVLTDIDGNFSVRSFVPDQIDVGATEVSLSYNGSQFYTSSSNQSTIYVRSHTVMKFNDISPNATVFYRGYQMSGKVLLTDDLGNPLTNETVKIYWVKQGEDPIAEATDRQREIRINRTDNMGRVFFNVTFQDGVPKEEIQTENRSLYAIYDGRFINTSYGISSEVLIHSMSNFSFQYKVQKNIFRGTNLLLFLLLIVSVVCVVVGYLFYEMNKRRALKGMQTIIRKAADQLVAGNEYAAVIFKAYRKLAANMKRYGYMRRDSETFREFEDAIRQAIPIDAHAMDDFIAVLEEARYSSHEMGEPDRDRAIESLRRVQFSLEKVVLSEDQLKNIQTRAAELSTADEAEPIIIVDGKRVGGGAPPPKPGSAPPKPGGAAPPPPPKPSGPAK